MKRQLLLILAIISMGYGSFAQTWTVGTGTTSNGSTAYPAPYGAYYYGARHQFIYTAAELSAAGVTAGNIDKFGFNVTALNGAGVHTGFTISMKNSDTTALTTWQTGLTQVLNPINYQPVTGWNLHTLDTPFNWDGTSNIIVEVCFNNTAYTNNASTQWTTGLTANISRTYRADAAGVCANTGVSTGNYTDTNRPNAQFARNLNEDPQALIFVTPVSGGCYGSTETVTVKVKNNGLAALDFSVNPLTVNVSVATTNPTTFSPVVINTGTLAVGATQDVVISTNYNMSAVGVYDFTGNISMTADGGATNNTFAPLSVTVGSTLSSFPIIEDFETATVGTPGTPPSGWSINPTTGYLWNIDENGTPSTGTGPNVDNTTGTITGNYLFTESSNGAQNDVANFTSPCIDLSSISGAKMDFYYHFFGATTGKLYVDVYSGGIWTTIDSIVGQQQTVQTAPWLKKTSDLAAFTGIIKVRFRSLRGSSFTGDMAIDDIKIYEPSSTDVEALAFINPTTGACYGSTETVTVRVKNSGLAAIDFSVSPLTVNVSAATTNPTTFTPVVINTGTLAVSATQDFVISTTYNMSTVGVYDFTGTVSMTNDGDGTNNDFDPISVTVGTTLSTFPIIEDFETSTVGTPGTPPTGWIISPTTGYLWNIDENGTPSTSTGPTVDHTTGTTTGNYLFTEASNGTVGNVALFTSPCINLSSISGAKMDFYYHFFGTTMGKLYVDIYSGGTWTTVDSIIGQQQTVQTAPWLKRTSDLSAFNGTVKVRFRSLRGTDFYGDMAIDDIKIYQPATIDLEATALFAPSAGCFGTNQTISVRVKNNGLQTLDFSVNPLTINAAVATTNPTTFTPVVINSGTLAIGATQDVVISTTYDMSTNGTYNFTGNVALTGDGDASNDNFPAIARTVAIATPLALPYIQDFNSGTTLAGISWTGNMLIAANHGRAGSNGLYRNMYSTVTTSDATSPKIGTVASNTTFNFKYRVVDYTGFPASDSTVLTANDSIIVEVSNDCGLTFAPIHVITGANHTPTTAFAGVTISLGAYSGSDVYVRYRLKWAAGDYYVDIDEINIETPALVYELVAQTFVSPAGSCFGTTETVAVEVKNTGVNPITFSTANELIVNASVTGTNPTTFSPVSITSGTLDPDSVMTVIVSAAYDMSANGTYDFVGDFTLTDDADGSNNSFSALSLTANNVTAGTLAIINPTVCQFDTVFGMISGYSTGANFDWEISYDGTNFGSIGAPNLDMAYGIIDTVATHYVRVSVSNGTCSTYSNIETFNVSELPVVNAGTDIAVCATTTSINLSASTSTGNTYTWSTGGTGSFTNTAILDATYTASSDDVTDGSVLLTVNVVNGACSVSDNVEISFNTVPTVDAGSDLVVCENATSVTLNGSVTTATGVNWTTTATGTINDATATSTGYIPSTADITAGSIVFVITTTGNGACDAVYDTVMITFNAIPTVNAGSDQLVCDDVTSVDLSASLTVATGSTWTTSGTGTITDATALTTTYSPTATDIAAGSVTFTITSSGNGACDAATDDVVITFENCSGIKNVTTKSNVTVYPNPTSGLVNIKLASNNVALVNVTNAIGQVVVSETINGSNSVDLSSFEQGIYTVTVIENNNVTVNKINLVK